jgi:HsdM N-terminal domain
MSENFRDRAVRSVTNPSQTHSKEPDRHPTQPNLIEFDRMIKLADLIWKNAELLRGAYKENEYRKVILPFTILRRLDCVLRPARESGLQHPPRLRRGVFAPLHGLEAGIRAGDAFHAVSGELAALLA